MKKFHPVFFSIIPLFFGLLMLYIPDTASTVFFTIVISTWCLYLLELLIVSFVDVKRKTKLYSVSGMFSFVLVSFYCLIPVINVFGLFSVASIFVCVAWVTVILMFFVGNRLLAYFHLQRHKKTLITIYFCIVSATLLLMAFGGTDERMVRWGIPPLFVRVFGEIVGWKLLVFLMSFSFSQFFLFPLYLEPLMEGKETKETGKRKRGKR